MSSSINRNQPEHNHDDLAGPQAVDKIRALVEKAQTCFFCTKVMVTGSMGARPMNVRKVDDNGSLWFLSAIDSHLNRELARDPSVHLYFQASPHSGFLHLIGRARVTQDAVKIHELWEPMIKTWFTQGEQDPRITVIEVIPTEGYYWDVKHGNLVAGIKMMIGAAMGETLDASIEGAIRL